MEGGIFPDWLMLIVTIAAIIGAGYYARRREDYIVAAWIVPLLLMTVFFGSVTFQIDPLHDHEELRETLERTGEFFLFLFMFVRFLDGSINKVIAQFHPVWTRFQARVVRRIERSPHWQILVFRLRTVRNRLEPLMAKGAEWISRFKP